MDGLGSLRHYARAAGAFLGGQLGEAPYDHPWYVEQGKKELIHVIGLLNGHLASNGPYVMGDHFTIADIPMGLVVNRWFMISNLERPDYRAVTAYYELMTERPDFANTAATVCLEHSDRFQIYARLF